LSINASVLHLRGTQVTSQPHENGSGDIFCWNGEIFAGMDISNLENDGSKLFKRLTDSGVSPVAVLAEIEGPYAFLFYRAADHSLFFGRDPLGRRSLLYRTFLASDGSWTIQLTSASSGGNKPPSSDSKPSDAVEFAELDTAAIYQLQVNLLRVEELGGLDISSHPSADNSDLRPGLPQLSGLVLNRTIPPAPDIASSAAASLVVDEFLARLEKAVGGRVKNIPPRGTSGQSRLALLFSGGIDCTIIAYLTHRFVPPNEAIDLVNVAFENPRSIRARQERKPAEASSQTPYDVPDRETGIEALNELHTLCPDRTWNFVSGLILYMNQSLGESTAARPFIEKLMFPSRTVMDMSLALALYFASQGHGGSIPINHAPGTPYTTPARVLLSGLGADELLGGYSRHRAAFAKGNWEGLINELQLDLDRLPSRNLGRDDRVISSNAKETRYPFLDLSLVAYLAALPVHAKLDPRLGEGSGDKLLLRLAAQRLGLEKTAARRKRAMQFGSRSAKMTENPGEKRGDLLVS
ncbi:hypothetical protein DL93DRAFT_2064754, partial [Clavulina sp. PMI_390]